MTKHRKKKLRKTNPSQLKEKILKYFLKNPKKRMNAGQLIKKLRIKGNST